ncbi:MAG: DUF927 domain-containing protein [Cyanobacteria bacterium SIG26]|nr:DUF927 domain-containing protein [Cyanobacteria bacterium SIG26]
MTKYIINENNCLVFYFTDKNGDLKSAKCANYSLENLVIMKFITNTKNQFKVAEKRVLRLTKESNPQETYIKIIDGNDEFDLKSFFNVIHKDTIGLVEDFNRKKFLLLMEMLNQNPKIIHIYSNFGYQPRENSYIFSNKKVLINERKIENYPLLPDNLPLTEQEKLQILSANGIVPKLYECENPKIVLEEFVNEVKRVFDAPILMAIAIGFACCFFDLFISKAQGFPYIIFYGESNAGKSTILHMLAAFYGITNMTTLTSGTSTGVSLRAQLEKYNNFLVFFEEIDRFKIHYIEDLGKDSFSANPRKKSSKDGKEIITEINSSFCVGTNHFFEEMTFANFSRCIPVNLRRGKFDLSDFKYHSADKFEKLSSFLPEILFYRDKILDIYQEQYKIAQKHCSFARVCNNIAIGMAIWIVINDILGKEVVNTETLVIDYLDYFEQYLDTELSYGDVFLSDVYNLFCTEKLVYGRDFVITKGKFLRINLTKYCDVFNSSHENKKLTPAQIRLKLANDKRMVCLKGSDMKPIGKAIKIDISQNEILLDILNRVSKHPEDEESSDE